jgi:hypothetical protein
VVAAAEVHVWQVPLLVGEAVVVTAQYMSFHGKVDNALFYDKLIWLQAFSRLIDSILTESLLK